MSTFQIVWRDFVTWVPYRHISKQFINILALGRLKQKERRSSNLHFSHRWDQINFLFDEKTQMKVVVSIFIKYGQLDNM